MNTISGFAFRWTPGLLLLLLLSLGAFSQETSGSLNGRVTDAGGNPLEGATVVALHTATGTKYGVMAGKDGRYFLNNLQIGGPYQVTASMMGMGTDTKEGIMIRLGGSLQLDLALKESTRQLGTVTVAARTGQSQQMNGTGKNISSQQLRNMPTISRSITDITRLTPQGSRDNSFGGTNFRYNNVTIDGAVNNDAIGFSPSLGGQTGTSGMIGSSTRTNPVSLDAIADMQVYLAPYDVKIGNFTGGAVNAVTRSGTNTLSGSVYVLGRNATITGKDRVGNLGKMNRDFHDYQTGFRIGFPIIKNKLFFFSNEEITSRQDPSQLAVGTSETAHILSKEEAETIAATMKSRYGNSFDAGAADVYNNWNRSQKFFNRLDWNINDKHQLAIRNNTIFSKATHLDRDQQDFRFSSMAFRQTNNQSSTVAELKSRFNNRLSGNVVVGFTVVNDKRDPLSDPSLPQVQIMGRAPGTTIYLGTDREASIFNMRQQTWEFTANVNYVSGRHRILAGTHNELYNIRYGFVNSWNGRVDYLSIADFMRNNPYRVRGNYNYTDNTRDYLLAHPAATFKVNMYSLYVQDEIRVNDRLQVTPGLRADFTHLPVAPLLSDKVRDIRMDANFGGTYTYTPLSRLTNGFLNKVQLSPRIGFRYDVLGDRNLILRGGAGLFTGRIPFAWLAYAYYNTGDSYGAFDQRADQKPFAGGSDALRPGPNGIGHFIEQNGAVINNPNSGKTQVDLVDNNFVLPQVLRTSVGIDYAAANDWRFTIEAMYTRNIKDVLFQQLNTKDNAYWFGYDTARQQPVYNGTVDPRFSNTYLLSNTNQGYRYSVTGTVSKKAGTKWEVSASYTYGESKDLSNGVRNSMESNWQLNQALVPNHPALSYSNFDIRHRIIANISYNQEWKAAGNTNISLFFSAQSGSPFTYGIVNNSIQGLPQQVSLVYIPQREEAVHYFKDLPAKTAAVQADAFNTFIDGNAYLSSRRGQFTARNAGRTPWNIQADLHVAHDLFLNKSKSRFITITADVMNLTNLLHKNWGIQYFSPNTFNSTSSVGLTPVLFPPQQNKDNYPVFTFDDPGMPYSVDYFGSRVQMQVGVRYTFL
ncbi:TonB-dependent receptor [Chitinophaga nivalis]|uniref:Carboxypeptidase regulatory-like domain-containing protein n=1 Tax=Chitinophaga nivalis TaxID=2991709 RepID=A0ABT3IIZ5_9BACT|nr:carboxypeptidase regulatory-like domain-containing protein [Chitinophaga nivalis]MCW3466377.1 carboxypeptidase regulatory-like domain-containing protein [Chitinophaga nivalis]MCW3483932.1 carboxypeptidase regulatory-like domain-containing protein [Chitinophaga nivalis]